MRELNIKDIITLEDDQKYIVAGKIDYNGTKYYSLSSMTEAGKILTVKFEGEQLLEESDDIILAKIIPELKKCILSELKTVLHDKLQKNNN